MTRTLGVDLGDVRIGLAISDPGGTVATPLATIDVADAGDLEAIVADLAAAVGEHGVERVVVGLPRKLSGREGRAAQRARAVASRLAEVAGVEVDLWDERLTSVEAERALLAQDASRRERREVSDRVAATIILQTYLDSRRTDRSAGSEGG